MKKLRVCSAWRGQGDCLACDGRENAFFAGLSPDMISSLDVDVHNTSTSSNQIFYQPGGQPDYLWVLRTGAIKLLATSWDGTQRIVRVLKAGDVAGLEALIAEDYAHTAITVGPVNACRVPLKTIKQLCMKHSDFQWELMGKLQAALRETEQWLVDLASSGVSARIRMARLLLLLRDGKSNRIHIFLREELGLMLGITIETASRIIAAFKRERLLVKRGIGSHVYDGDIAGLEKVAQGQ